jgi:transaldolase
MVNKTRLFLDGGDPAETVTVNAVLKDAGLTGLDGQTTNPSLIAKNLGAKAGGGRKLTAVEAYAEYRRIVTEMSAVVAGPVSIQVICDETTPAEDILAMARERLTWIPNAMIKFPCIPEGLKAASVFCHEGPVNMTLVFSQDQAAAVYSATRGAEHPVVVSPFVGRLDDKGQDGMSLIANILCMYEKGDGHVSVLSASVRTMDHFKQALKLGSDIMTVPASVYTMWKEAGFPVPDEAYAYPAGALTAIPYAELPLDRPFAEYPLHHELTDAGLKKFLSDWHTWVE